ncbi:MAG: hypothetical protein ABW219_17145 [Ilumatobacteraceae bacterium]
MVARALMMIALVAAATACDGTDDDEAADGDSVAWCAQFDAAIMAGAAVDELGADDPGTDEALAAVNEEFAALGNLDPPAAIAEDWQTVAATPTTDETGALDLGGERAEAGDRIADWALQECELSTGARAELDD